MNLHGAIAVTAEQRLSLQQRVNAVVDPRQELPSYPFQRREGVVDFCRYSSVLSTDLGQVSSTLARANGDLTVGVAMLAMVGEHDRLDSDRLPLGFTLPADEAATQTFLDCLDADLQDTPGVDSSMYLNARTFVACGPSASWAVYGDRDFDLAIVWSAATSPIWRQLDLPFEGLEEALDGYVAQEFWPGLAVPPDFRAEFLEAFTHLALQP